MDPNSSVLDAIAKFVQAEGNIPYVMLMFAFVASLVLTILKIVDIITHKSSVEFRITREIFLRVLAADGECLYVNGVLVANDCGALVERANATLEMQNEKGSVKRFKLDILAFGEQVRTETGLYSFSFYSRSPLGFLPESVPQRITYLCGQENYAQPIKSAFYSFGIRVYGLRDQYLPIGDEDTERLRTLYTSTEALIEETCSAIMDSVQAEPGKYDLKLTLYCRQRGKLLRVPRRKKVTSCVVFEIEEGVREHLRRQLRLYLEGTARNIFLNQNNILASPEYAPISIVEK